MYQLPTITPHTSAMLRRVFGEHLVDIGTNQHHPEPGFLLGMDYLHMLLFSKARQRLPVLVLRSKERCAGLTTFLMWICDTLGAAALCRPKDLDDFIAARAAAVDEAYLGAPSLSERVLRHHTSVPAVNILLATNGPLPDEFNRDRMWIREVPQVHTPEPDFDIHLRRELTLFYPILGAHVVRTVCESRIHFRADLLTQ